MVSRLGLFVLVLVAVLVAAVSVFCAGNVVAAEDDFRAIFNGRDLDGWSAPDMRYWSVEDGAITARSTAELPCRENQFLVWQQGDLDDFELKLRFRLLGSDEANSGIQIRSQVRPDGHAVGYQADMDRAGQWLGALYDEATGRGALAKRGQRTVIDKNGQRESAPLETQVPAIDLDQWNEYHIVARGPQLTLRINNAVTAEVIDRQQAASRLWGRLALQLHSGPPTTVQFKDIRLKRLPLSDGRKKIVVIAGGPSHPSAQHEFNAGVKLLAGRLRKLDSVTVANYHDNGWPHDPTALDNADAIVVYADGEKSHPLAGHFDEIDALMKRGVGLMCMHYAVHVAAGAEGEIFKRWIGGFYESDYSSNPHWNAELRLGATHPILRGIEPAPIYDEWYFSIRFRDKMQGVSSLLEAKPSDKTRSMNGWPPKPYPHIIAAVGQSETLMWAVERSDGGRGVGFTGGHWHRNWAVDMQRDIVLNAMLWVAGAEVPDGGVQSPAVSEAELNENLDRKQNMVRVELPKTSAPTP